MASDHSVALKHIALWTALLPILTIHLAYLIAADQGHVPWCFPYIDSCTSISATGRRPPEGYLFTGGMLISALLMLLYWWLAAHWLKMMSPAATTAVSAMWTLGLIASCGLVLYSLVLGDIGEHFRLMRRIGVTLYFSLTLLAQLLMTRQLMGLVRTGPRSVPARLVYGFFGLVLATLAVGISNVIASVWHPAYHSIDDAFEWCFAILMDTYYGLTYLLWRHTDYRLSLALSGPQG